MTKTSLKKLVLDYLAFAKFFKTNKVIIIIVYIDNFFFWA